MPANKGVPQYENVIIKSSNHMMKSMMENLSLAFVLATYFSFCRAIFIRGHKEKALTALIPLNC
jgi:hypothetical protein